MFIAIRHVAAMMGSVYLEAVIGEVAHGKVGNFKQALLDTGFTLVVNARSPSYERRRCNTFCQGHAYIRNYLCRATSAEMNGAGKHNVGTVEG